jgi:hypothetical protein
LTCASARRPAQTGIELTVQTGQGGAALLTKDADVTGLPPEE